MKDIKEFRTLLTQELQEQLGEGYEIIEKQTDKINRITKLGLIVKKEDDIVCPVIYLEELYQRYVDGEEMGNLVTSFLEVLEEKNNCEELERGIAAKVWNWDFASKHVLPKLINTDANEEYLSDKPHVEICDLSVLFYVPVGESFGNETGMASVTVTNQLMEIYDITVEKLMETAVGNMEKTGITVRPIVEMMMDLLGDGNAEGIDLPEIDDTDTEMYVITNSSRMFGAAAIVSKLLREKLAEKFKRDLYILPSSLHELIILPATEDFPAQYLLSMVKEINSTEVSKEDILADNVYLFHADTLEVTITA